MALASAPCASDSKEKRQRSLTPPGPKPKAALTKDEVRRIKFELKLKDTLEELQEDNKELPCALHAALQFILQLIRKVQADPEDPAIQNIPKASRTFKYIGNLKGGKRLMRVLGFVSSGSAWGLQGAAGVLLRAAPLLEGALQAVGQAIEQLELKPVGLRVFEKHSELTGYSQRVVGMFLAMACGDALGAPVTGWRGALIHAWFGQMKQFQDLPHKDTAPGGLGIYTAETELMLATSMSILSRELFDVKSLVEAYTTVYTQEPVRAYADPLKAILPLIMAGDDYRKMGTYLGPQRHTHHEGLARLIPLAVCFRNAPDSTLNEAIHGGLLFTTIHTDVRGACFVLLKLIIALTHTTTTTTHTTPSVDGKAMVAKLLECSQCNTMRARLQLILSEAQPTTPGCYSIPPSVRENLSESIQTEAVEIVSIALCIFMQHWPDPTRAIIEAVHEGGETATLGAVVGALMGALHGCTWLPRDWFEEMENDDDESGRDVLIATAIRLAQCDLTKSSQIKHASKMFTHKGACYVTES
eukprot:NODE_1126_length_1646_cov_34.211982_g1059_i0.p1 GENE.NODE_1126_length_1646_cov_34.211982_g1059_i0~~NODE_1126_length_1646_cov_34.211982_g1059_i0.p1  ORF type:complete len:528 (-),score=154.31 NODE_1126_length_1646_cov_34.211982_g1059_i0:11-1594(-)